MGAIYNQSTWCCPTSTRCVSPWSSSWRWMVKFHRRSLSIEDDVVSSGCVLHEVVRVSWRSATTLDWPFILRRRRTTFGRLQPAAVRSSFMRVPFIARASEIFRCGSLASFRQRLRSASQLPSGKHGAWLLLVSVICSERCRPVPHRMSSMLSHAFAKNSTMLARLLWTSTKPCWVSFSLSDSVVYCCVNVDRSPTAWQSDRARSTSVGSYTTYMSRRCRSEGVRHSSMCTCRSLVLVLVSRSPTRCACTITPHDVPRPCSSYSTPILTCGALSRWPTIKRWSTISISWRRRCPSSQRTVNQWSRRLEAISASPRATSRIIRTPLSGSSVKCPLHPPDIRLPIGNGSNSESFFNVCSIDRSTGWESVTCSKQRSSPCVSLSTQLCFQCSIDLLVFTVPENTTAMFRCFIESLFATHAESKLNLMNLLSSDTNQVYGPPYRLDIHWCQSLVRRPIPSPSSEQWSLLLFLAHSLRLCVCVCVCDENEGLFLFIDSLVDAFMHNHWYSIHSRLMFFLPMRWFVDFKWHRMPFHTMFHCRCWTPRLEWTSSTSSISCVPSSLFSLGEHSTKSFLGYSRSSL